MKTKERKMSARKRTQNNTTEAKKTRKARPNNRMLAALVREHFEQWSQCGMGMLKAARASKNPDDTYQYVLTHLDNQDRGGSPSAEPLIPNEIYEKTYEKMHRSVHDFLVHLHQQNPEAEKVGAMLREWLDKRFPAAPESNEDSLERVCALAGVLSIGTEVGLIPYRQLPREYNANMLPPPSDKRWHKLTPTLSMIRRATIMENIAAGKNVLLKTLPTLSRREQHIAISVFAYAVEDITRRYTLASLKTMPQMVSISPDALAHLGQGARGTQGAQGAQDAQGAQGDTAAPESPEASVGKKLYTGQYL